jgi:hypothetical protein
MVHSTYPNARHKTPIESQEALSISRKITDPFSEQDILELQDEFLTNGFHYITVSNLEQGRKIIDTFLSSLNYYYDIGYLSLSNQKSINNAENIYKLLKDGDCFEIMRFDEFFLEHWYYDFVWIEAIEPLWHLSWFKKLYQHLVNGAFDESLPIFILSYTDLQS